MDSDKKSSQAHLEESSPAVEPSQVPSTSSPRIPEPVAGIQINVCKTPSCENFGLPEHENIPAYDKSGTSRYVKLAAGKNHPMLKCRCCGVSFTMKSNQGVFEELQRIERMALPSTKPLCCPVETCENHGNDVALGKPLYSSFGTTSAGSPRYKCNACGKTFSTPSKSTHRQRESHKNKQIFTLLMNKMPLRRICEVVELNPASVYGKIDFLYEQCLAFMASREARLPELPVERLYIGVDRQDYQVNWTAREDKRNVVLSAVGSVDNATLYCFGLHLNFDPQADRERVEHEAAHHKGAAASALRPHARLWLQSDYERSMAQQSKKPKPAYDVQQKVANTYASADTRADIDVPDQPQSAQMLPARGMQVHGEYTLNAHFQHLRNLTAKAGKVRLFLDQDAGMRSAALTAFAHDIKVARRCDAFYVSIAKELTVDQKRAITRKAGPKGIAGLHGAVPGAGNALGCHLGIDPQTSVLDGTHGQLGRPLAVAPAPEHERAAKVHVLPDRHGRLRRRPPRVAVQQSEPARHRQRVHAITAPRDDAGTGHAFSKQCRTGVERVRRLQTRANRKAADDLSLLSQLYPSRRRQANACHAHRSCQGTGELRGCAVFHALIAWGT